MSLLFLIRLVFHNEKQQTLLPLLFLLLSYQTNPKEYIQNKHLLQVDEHVEFH